MPYKTGRRVLLTELVRKLMVSPGVGGARVILRGRVIGWVADSGEITLYVPNTELTSAERFKIVRLGVQAYLGKKISK